MANRFIKVKVPLFHGAARTVCVYDSEAYRKRPALLVALLSKEADKKHSMQELTKNGGVGWDLEFFTRILVEPEFDVNFDGTPTTDIIGVKITVSKRGIAKYKAVYSLADCFHEILLDKVDTVKPVLNKF